MIHKYALSLFLVAVLIFYSFLISIPIVICVLISFISKNIAMHLVSILTYLLWLIFSLLFNIKASINISQEFRALGDCILVSNHIGSIDFMIINEIAIRHNALYKLKYIVKEAARNIPVYGWGMKAVGFLTIKRNFLEDKQKIVTYCNDVKKNCRPLWLVVYPEGSRFTEEKRSKAVDFAKKRGLKPLENVLLPRVNGFKLILENLRDSHVKYVLDVTIFMNSPKKHVHSFLKFLYLGFNTSFNVDIRLIPISEIEDPERFLQDSFVRKDKIISAWLARSKFL